MSQFINGCRHHRAHLSLLASGVLSTSQRAQVEGHLAVCAACRKYYDEIKALTEPLARWERAFAHMEPRPSVRTRWIRAIETDNQPIRVRAASASIPFVVWCQNLIWRYRRVWAGLAAAWLVIFALNLSLRDPDRTVALKSPSSSAAMVLSFLEQDRWLTELTMPNSRRAPESPKAASPGPRSDRGPELRQV